MPRAGPAAAAAGLATTALRAGLATTALRAVLATTALRAVLATSALRAVLATYGLRAVLATYGLRAVLATYGLRTTDARRPILATSARRAARALALLLAAAGLALAVHGLWIPAKAVAAQVLLAAAWERAEAGAARPRPWPWADTWPVGRLTLPGRWPLVVLAGAQGRTLAFGPGHVDGTARPGEAGNVVLAGHRDTHFRALGALAPGDELTLEAPGGAVRRYRVVETAVVDHRDTRALLPADGARLTLVTCWPFDAVRPGGPLRWVVVADAVAGPPAPPAAGAVISRAATGSRRPGRGGP